MIWLRNFIHLIDKSASQVAILLIRLYRMTLSPSVGIFRHLPLYPKPSCIFYPTCSAYGISCFTTDRFFPALIKTIRRIGRCHPGSEPRVDLP